MGDRFIRGGALAAVLWLSGCGSNTIESGTVASEGEAATIRDQLCVGNDTNPSVRDRGVTPTLIRGYNPALYFEYSFSESVDLSTLNTRNLPVWRQEMLKQQQPRMRRKLLADIDADPGRWVYRSGIREALTAAGQPEEWPPADLPVQVTSERATTDCLKGLYTYTAKMVISREPLEEMPELRTLIGEGMKQPMQEALEPLQQRGTVTLQLPGRAIEALRRNVNREEMATLRDRYRDKLRFVDSETQLLVDWLSGSTVPVAPFDSADYRLGGDMILVLSALAEAFVRVAEPDQAYEISVVGRTDARSMGTRPYVGGANLGLGPGQRAAFAEGGGASTLQGNQQLSVARGYAAAEAFAGTLKEKASTNVSVQYGGDGPMAGPAVDTDRRLEITLRKVSARAKP